MMMDGAARTAVTTPRGHTASTTTDSPATDFNHGLRQPSVPVDFPSKNYSYIYTQPVSTSTLSTELAHTRSPVIITSHRSPALLSDITITGWLVGLRLKGKVYCRSE